MCHVRIAAVAVCAFSVWTANTSLAITYKATPLNTVGFIELRANGISGSSQVGQGRLPKSPFGIHALLWDSTAANPVDLHPACFLNSYAYSVDGETQVGFGEINSQTPDRQLHALLWNGSADSVIDLHPPNFRNTYASAISGNMQVGFGSAADFGDHALIWHGTAASVIDRHPPGYTSSRIIGLSTKTQVGWATIGDASHAILWDSSPGGGPRGFVDLHPANFANSLAIDATRTKQVGSGYSNVAGAVHALLWNSGLTSYVDLNPTGFSSSEARGITENQMIIGFGRGPATNNLTHALVWNGTAESAIDLHPSLVALDALFRESIATGISDDGTIVGAATDSSGAKYAVIWSPIPEPGSAALFLCGLLAVAITCSRFARIGKSPPSGG